MVTLSWTFLGDAEERVEHLGFILPSTQALRNKAHDERPDDSGFRGAEDFYALREWVASQGMVVDQSDFLDDERIERVCRAFVPNDHVRIGVDVPSPGSSGNWLYIEYFVIPMFEVIRKGIAVDLYWRVLRTNSWYENDPTKTLESLLREEQHLVSNLSIRFGFWEDGTQEELVVVTWGTRVVRAFQQLTKTLTPRYDIHPLSEREWEMAPDDVGDVKAYFFKVGAAYDVRFRHS